MNYLEHNQDYYSLLSHAARAISNIILRKDVYQSLDKEIADFMLWLLKDNNQHQENYLRMLGVAGSIELELKLLQPVIPDLDFINLTDHISLLNAYFAYETISDNLAVGMANGRREQNNNYNLQRDVILNFNRAMIKKINGAMENGKELLNPIAEKLTHISVNDQTLSPLQMDKFIDSYAHHIQCNKEKLDKSFMAILILNIVTCQELLSDLHESPIYPILQKSLLNRYCSVSQIICHADSASRVSLCKWGKDSMLVIPTYAFCIGALETLLPSKNFKLVIKNGLLYSTMVDGSLLTRLLNDIGTRLLTLSEAKKNLLFKELVLAAANKKNTIFECLLNLSKQQEFYLPLTRIRKDIENGEFNLCLDNLNHEGDIKRAMKKFCENIDYYRLLYHKTYANMLKKYQKLNHTLQNDHASKIIHNFVLFHEYKYSFDYNSMMGDYAVTHH